jgi:hypothetical protein
MSTCWSTTLPRTWARSRQASDSPTPDNLTLAQPQSDRSGNPLLQLDQDRFGVGSGQHHGNTAVMLRFGDGPTLTRVTSFIVGTSITLTEFVFSVAM